MQTFAVPSVHACTLGACLHVVYALSRVHVSVRVEECACMAAVSRKQKHRYVMHVMCVCNVVKCNVMYVVPKVSCSNNNTNQHPCLHWFSADSGRFICNRAKEEFSSLSPSNARWFWRSPPRAVTRPWHTAPSAGGRFAPSAEVAWCCAGSC